MQCTTYSKLYRVYCIADVAGWSALFLQPQNTVNWGAGSNIDDKCYAHLFVTELEIMEGVYGSL